eukprot:NODE_2484_length_918_cov_74.302647_g2040_i0.p1 GENE.NODE_2484_length_918_cov_74.302647_g2040_i0~~NODE_2484_length_918_cov_74.302647_g2040_i0.p1  ORF type:complete len:85 (-),score=8.30 NODE_2484_length_918_cov_74.302647_g2040_i0:385-639(-)
MAAMKLRKKQYYESREEKSITKWSEPKLEKSIEVEIKSQEKSIKNYTRQVKGRCPRIKMILTNTINKLTASLKFLKSGDKKAIS